MAAGQDHKEKEWWNEGMKDAFWQREAEPLCASEHVILISGGWTTQCFISVSWESGGSTKWFNGTGEPSTFLLSSVTSSLLLFHSLLLYFSFSSLSLHIFCTLVSFYLLFSPLPYLFIFLHLLPLSPVCWHRKLVKPSHTGRQGDRTTCWLTALTCAQHSALHIGDIT